MNAAEQTSRLPLVPRSGDRGDDGTGPRFVSFAQNFEDVMLWRALGHVDAGFYVDVGAQDPVLDSVSKAFYDRGWSGIDIEPVPEYAALLRTQRPRNRVLECAIAERGGAEPFFVFGDSGLSTLLHGQAERNRELLGLAFATSTVEVRALRDVLAEVASHEVHWLKIDVEGAEEQVLRSWEGSTVFPWIVVVEATRPNEQSPSHETWEQILIGAGYAFVYFDGLNRFYVAPAHRELQSAFLVPPNVFDRFTLAAIDRSDQSFAKAERYAKSLEAEMSQQRDALREKTEAVKDAETRRNREMEEAAAYAASLEAEVAARGSRLQHLEDELLRLRDLLERTDLELESQRTTSAKHQTALQTASVYATSLEAEVAARGTRIQHLEDEVARLRDLLERTDRELESQRTSAAKHHTALQSATVYATSLEEELAARADRLQVVEHELVRVRASVDEMVEQHRQQRSEREVAYAALEVYAQSLEKVRGEQLAELDKRASALSLERAAREMALMETRRVQAESDRQTNELRAARDAALSEHQHLTAILHDERRAADVAASALNSQNNQLADTVAEWRKQALAQWRDLLEQTNVLAKLAHLPSGFDEVEGRDEPADPTSMQLEYGRALADHVRVFAEIAHLTAELRRRDARWDRRLLRWFRLKIRRSLPS